MSQPNHSTGSLISRLLRGLSSIFIHDPSPDAEDYGVDFAPGMEQPARYSPDNACSAAETFAWVYAAVIRRSAAMAGLPVRVYRRDGRRRVYLPDHWLVDLMERPSTSVDGLAWRRDLYCDLLLAGESYVKVVNPDGLGKGTASLQRLHPYRVSQEVGRGGIVGLIYDLGGQKVTLSPDVVCHVRMPAFRSDPDQLFHGVGAIQPLSDELSAEHYAVLRAKDAAKRGRPDVIISPEKEILDAKTRGEIAQEYTRLTAKGGGAIVPGAAVKVTPVTWTARDLEFADGRRYTREGILATLATPPVVMGLETANFATAREQSGQFWQAVQDEVALVDSGLLTRILRLAGERDTYAEHDVSGVKPLQAWRSDAIQRAVQLSFLGVDTDTALRAEGLEDVADLVQDAKARRAPAVPAPAATPAASEPPKPAPAAEPATAGAPPGTTRGPDAWWRSWGVQRAPAPAPASEDDDAPVWPPVGEEARATTWRAFVAGVHGVGERGLALAVRRSLTAQADAIASRLEGVWPETAKSARGTVTREVAAATVESLLGALLDVDALTTAMRGETEDIRRTMLERAIRAALVQVGESGPWEPSRVDEMVDAVLGTRIVDRAMEGDGFAEVTDTTREAVRVLVADGLDEGATIAEMQWRIQNAEAFSPARALRIARTETTRSVNAGAVISYREAGRELGAAVDRQWLTARDGEVRDEHWALDGQTVGPDEKFIVPASGNGHVSDPQFVGATADAPGGFGQAALVVNCRCTVVPVVREAASDEDKETA